VTFYNPMSYLSQRGWGKSILSLQKEDSWVCWDCSY